MENKPKSLKTPDGKVPEFETDRHPALWMNNAPRFPNFESQLAKATYSHSDWCKLSVENFTVESTSPNVTEACLTASRVD